MYRELQPLRQTLRKELGASLLPCLPGIEPDKLLDIYLDQLTLFVGADVADHTLSLLAIDASKEELGSKGAPNARYAAANMADHLRHKVPYYNAMYRRITGRKPPHQSHFVALVASPSFRR